jgi:hypothetical protein
MVYINSDSPLGNSSIALFAFHIPSALRAHLPYYSFALNTFNIAGQVIFIFLTN